MVTRDPFRPPAERRAIEAQAAAFAARRAGGRAAEEDAAGNDDLGEAALARWIDADPAHAVAFAEAEAAWEAAGRLRADPPALVRHPPAEAEPEYRGPSRRTVAAGLLAAAFGGAGLLGWRRLDRDVYATAVGERRAVTLADGSIVRLNTESRIRVAFTAGRRTVRLVHGEALFDVAHDPARPFIVDVASGWIRAIGTAFNVRVRDALVELTVTEGVVTLGNDEHAHDDAARPRIGAGAGAVIRAGAVAETPLDPEVVRQRTAWRDGVIELDGSTVDQAVQEFNRYRAVPIVIGDPRVASLRVGGQFRTGEADKFLAALELTMPVRAVTGADGTPVLIYTELK